MNEERWNELHDASLSIGEANVKWKAPKFVSQGNAHRGQRKFFLDLMFSLETADRCSAREQ